MSKVKIIKPYVSEPTNMESLDGALYREGLSKVPGALTIIMPSLDAKGRVKTALDDEENRELRAQIENRLSEESVAGDSKFYEEYRERGVQIKDGDNVFDLNDPIAAIEYFMLIKTPQVTDTIDNFTNGKANPAYVHYYIHDPELAETKKYNANKEKTECIFLLGGASQDVLRQVAILTGVIVRAESSDTEIFNNLTEAIEQPAEYSGGNFRKEFIKYMNMSAEDRKIEVLALTLVKNNIVSVVGKAVREGNTKIADSMEDFKELLKKDDDLYISFQEKLEAKKTINVLL